MPRLFKRFAWLLAIVMIVAALPAGVPPASAQDVAAPAAPVAALEPARVTLDRVEETLKRDRLSTGRLVDLGRSVAPVRDDLRGKIASLEPQLAQADQRLKQLGPAPARDAPPEPEALAADRARLTDAFRIINAELRQARVLALRADQLTQQIADRRYAVYAEELLARSWSILDPGFWTLAAQAAQTDTRLISELLSAWGRHLATQNSWWQVAAAALSLLVVIVAATIGLRRWRRWFTAANPSTRLGKAGLSIWALVRTATFEPVFALVVMLILDGYGLLPASIAQIGYALVFALALGAFGRGVAVGVLAPHEPARRLLGGDDRNAQSLARHLIAASWLIVVFAFIDLAHGTVDAPPFLLVFTNALFAAGIAGVTLHLLYDLRETSERWGEEQASAGRLWYRAVAWVVAAAIGATLVTGHLRLADFLAERVLASIILAGAIYLLMVLADAFFAEAFTAGSPRGRAVAANLGLQPRRIALVGALLSGGVRLVLLAVAFAMIVVPWAGTTTDLVGAIQGFSLSVTIGDTTISFTAVFAALVTLIAGIAFTRAAQRWLETQILPRTELEQSLRVSIGTIFGYVGVIVAIMLALAVLGIDPQKIALIAGALSVGIGFGLQSIVSNFVCGLILLTERPIRVGDWIVAKGEEGYVRRIRVRSTEIETFDRAAVIIPNADLISGVVKNLTHTNTMGRVTVKIGAGYDSDPDVVREILLDVANAHAGVLSAPPPRALLMAFGDNALEFELRCIIRNVEESLLVRSDLNLAILARFRAAGIDIPYPQRTVHLAAGNETGPGFPEPAAKSA